jgi:hypothetical protein
VLPEVTGFRAGTDMVPAGFLEARATVPRPARATPRAMAKNLDVLMD